MYGIFVMKLSQNLFKTHITFALNIIE